MLCLNCFQTDQVDVRIKAVHLIGKLLTHSRLQVALEYRPLFIEFLKRFSDKSSEVRSSAVDCAKACYLVKSSGAEAFEILSEPRYISFNFLGIFLTKKLFFSQ